MKLVTFDQVTADMIGDRFSDAALATPGHAHDDHCGYRFTHRATPAEDSAIFDG
jgi:hypothetical protein